MSIRPAEGVRAARFVSPPPFSLVPHRRSRTQAEGIRYERKVQASLARHYAGKYLASPWIEFFDSSGRRWCQPDGLVIDIREGRITVVEVKLRHTADAYFQLVQLYAPVLSVLFPRPDWEIRLCEVCRWYDVAISFPVTVQLRERVDDVSPGRIGVHILDP